MWWGFKKSVILHLFKESNENYQCFPRKKRMCAISFVYSFRSFISFEGTLDSSACVRVGSEGLVGCHTWSPGLSREAGWRGSREPAGLSLCWCRTALPSELPEGPGAPPPRISVWEGDQRLVQGSLWRLMIMYGRCVARHVFELAIITINTMYI